MQIEINSGSKSLAGGRSTVVKGCMTMFFLVFLAMGSIFTVIILGEAVRAAAVWFWPETDCKVISSAIDTTGEDENPYTATVIFEYEDDGRIHRSATVSRGLSASSSYDRARHIVDRYPPGTRATCRVDPESPGEAVLERRLPTIALMVLLPLTFVAIGAGGIFLTWKTSSGFGATRVTESISQRAKGAEGLGGKIGFGVGLVFTLVGGVLTLFLLVIPGFRLIRAITWTETPATIVASDLRSWSTDDGMSYRADIRYQYSAEDRLFISNRRIFYPMNSGDYDGARAVIDRYPKANSTVCFVDPNDPASSILDRGFHPIYLIGLFPLVFLLVGMGLTNYSFKSRRADGSDTTATSPDIMEAGIQRILEPEAGPIAKIVGMTLFAAIWNGIVGIFVWQAVTAVRSGSPEWFLMIFLIPFVLVGLALIAGIFYTILAAFNPRPSLTISPAAPRLGTRLRLDWSFRGKVSRINQFTIILEGHEKATYRRGTDTITDREAFATIDVAARSSEWEIRSGSAEVEIPEDTMHSFTSANNGVVWSLMVRGEIPNWPDVDESFEIEIRPLARERPLP